MSYLFLAVAIVFEVGWAISMKVSDGFTRLWPSVVTLILYLLSLAALSLATRRLDIGVAYAIWAGIGAAFIAVIGVFWFKEPMTTLKVVSLCLVIAGVVGLNLSESPRTHPPAKTAHPPV